MWSTILPESMSVAVFILIILCLEAGKSPDYLQNVAILSLNTTGLKESYSRNNTNAVLPIHDVYTLYLTTTCRGYYANNSMPPLVNVICSPQSLGPEFLPGNLISNDLTSHGSNVTLASLSLPDTIQDSFNEGFNEQFHVALVFYIIALIWVGIAMVWGIFAFFKGSLGTGGMVFSGLASTWLFIASVIITVVQKNAAALVNDQGNAIGISVYYGMQLVSLTWAAFAINLVSGVVWCFAGITSYVFRSSEED